VIKYKEPISIIVYEDFSLLKNDIEALKYNIRKGLDTLLVYTIKYEYIVLTIINVKILRLGSTVARLKLNRIGGNLFERWNMWFNAIIRAKSYQNINIYLKKY